MKDFLDIIATQGAYLVPRADTPVFQEAYNDQFAAALEMQLYAVVVEQTCRTAMYHSAADEWPMGYTPKEIKEKRKVELEAQEELEGATSNDESDNDDGKYKEGNGIIGAVSRRNTVAASNRPRRPRRSRQAEWLPTPPMSAESPPGTLNRSKRRRVIEEDEEGKKRLAKNHVSSTKKIPAAAGESSRVQLQFCFRRRDKMKSVVLIITAALAGATPLDKRQGTLGGLMGYKAKAPASTKNIDPQFNKDAVRQIIRWGPYTLYGSGAKRPSGFRLDPNGDGFNEMLGGICTDCMILSGSTFLTYENETVADIGSGVYNHHVFVGDIGKSSKNYFSCGKRAALPNGVTSVMPGMSAPKAVPSHVKRQFPGGMPIAQIFGSGDDGGAIQYAVKGADNKIGFYVAPKDVIFSSSEFINYRKEEQKVYITFDLEFMKGKPEGWRDAAMGAMAATGCGGIAFIPPANQSTTLKSPAFTATTAGTIYNAQAHLHDGGIAVQLLLNGKMVCNSQAHYGGEKGTTSVGGEKWETIQGYDRCGAIEVNKGDQIVVESTYDLVKHRLRPGAVDHSMGAEAMAMMGFVFAEKV
ncbi:hypothetical protein BLS_000459 [Venturia inaequalis]|uniref:Uncharacterized protein n=1 Tax=Venturia inaequalis TaxID=5025 RepID=A0A8H3U3F1_VENIN|nr:hypothetical protein BLS_000459 [Venturia inaequalis]